MPGRSPGAMAKIALTLFYDNVYLYGATLSVLYIILPGSSNLKVWCYLYLSTYKNRTARVGSFTYESVCSE